MVALTLHLKLRDALIPKNAFGPLTLATYRLPGAEALSGGILLSSRQPSALSFQPHLA
jgi:hypothetical protein